MTDRRAIQLWLGGSSQREIAALWGISQQRVSCLARRWPQRHESTAAYVRRKASLERSRAYWLTRVGS